MSEVYSAVILYPCREDVENGLHADPDWDNAVPRFIQNGGLAQKARQVAPESTSFHWPP